MIYDFHQSIVCNIGNLTYELAKDKKINYVIFTGTFLRKNKLAKKTLHQFF